MAGLVNFGGLGLRVWLALTFHRVRIEGCGIAGNEACSGGNQGAVKDTARFTAGAHVDAGGVDTLLIGEVLFDVEVALGSGIRGFVGSVPSDDDQPGGRVAVEGEGDFVEAALGLIVDADRTLRVSIKGDAAEAAYGRRRGWRRSCDGDGGGGSGLLADVVDGVTGDCDRSCGSAAGNESRGGGRMPEIWPAEAEYE